MKGNTRNTRWVIRKGVCVCYDAPMARGGLEGYNERQEYVFAEMGDTTDKGHYFRVYHDEKYYETCGPTLFKQHFREISKSVPPSYDIKP